MEIEFGLPYFEEEGVKQEFRIKSRNYTWNGRVFSRKNTAIPVNQLQEVINESIKDASRGFAYVKVGNITGYKYRVELRKEEWNYTNTSSVEIKVYDHKGEEKISIWINPT